MGLQKKIFLMLLVVLCSSLILIPIVVDSVDVDPDHPFYFLERLGEDLKGKFVGDSNWHIDRATERLQEYVRMIEENREREYRGCISNYLEHVTRIKAEKETAEQMMWKIEKNIQAATKLKLTMPILGFWKVPRDAPLNDVVEISSGVKRTIEEEFQDAAVVRSGVIIRLENEEIETKLQRLASDENVPAWAALFLTQEDGGIKGYFLFSSVAFPEKPLVAATVQGKVHRLPEDLSAEFGFADGLISARKIEELEPIITVPSIVNYLAEEYAFKRIEMETMYIISTSSIYRQDALEPIGLGYATDHLGAPYVTLSEWYLAVFDPYHSESGILPARVTGIMLPSDMKVQMFLELALQPEFGSFGKMMQRLDNKPFLWMNEIKVKEAHSIPLEELVLNLDTCKYDRQILKTEGIALGEIASIDHGFPWSLEHFDEKMIGVIENESVISLIALDKEKVEENARRIFGRYSFELSIYTHIPRHYSTVTYPLIINVEAKRDEIIPLSQAEFGDWTSATLDNYLVMQFPNIQVTESLALKEIDLLLPEEPGNPMVLTKSERLAAGMKLNKIVVEGYLLDASVLKIPPEYIQRYGSRLIVCQEIHEI